MFLPNDILYYGEEVLLKMDLLPPESSKLLKMLSKKDYISKNEIDSQLKLRLYELVDLGYATTGLIQPLSSQDGEHLQIWKINTPGMAYIEEHKDINDLNTKEKWKRVILSLLSAIISVLTYLLIYLLFNSLKIIAN